MYAILSGLSAPACIHGKEFGILGLIVLGLLPGLPRQFAHPELQ